MDVFTLNVGQGQFVVVTGRTEGIIIDTSIPLNPARSIINVKSALTDILRGKNLIGLMITGFDGDHFNEVGVRIALNKYRPNWIMYPKYFKPTSTADAAFSAIKEFEHQSSINRIPVKLTQNDRRYYHNKSKDFEFEIFSPHAADMDSSNNCSLVCRIMERATGRSYLVTGDTENSRWDNIAKFFGTRLKSDILDVPHHGSKNGITLEAAQRIEPHTALISAGVDNKYGHPDREAITILAISGANVYSTNVGQGISLKTSATRFGIITTEYKVGI